MLYNNETGRYIIVMANVCQDGDVIEHFIPDEYRGRMFDGEFQVSDIRRGFINLFFE
jgi:hypothetical protein